MCLAAAVLLGAAACGDGTDRNLLPSEKVSEQVVDLFSPMEKTDPDAAGGGGGLSDLHGGGLPGQDL